MIIFLILICDVVLIVLIWWCFMLCFVGFGVIVWIGYCFLGSVRNFGLFIYFFVSCCICSFFDKLLVIFFLLGMCFYWFGFDLFWIFLIFDEINGLKFWEVYWIYVRVMVLLVRNLIDLNCILFLFNMDFVRCEVRIVVCNFRCGMVSCFRGVIFDLVVIKVIL